MAGELVSFGVQKLWNLLSQEYEHFQGVEDQVTELKSDLNLLKSFLKDAGAKKHTSALVRNCVQEINEIVYDAEDVIEEYLLKEKLGKTSGIKKRLRRIACIILDRRAIALYIQGISKRISKVIRDMQSFGVQQILVDDYMQPQHDREREMRQTFPKDYENDFVGLEANIKKLVGYLVEEDNVQVVSITGMGGLGKTTLARQVFNHEMVKNKFDGLAWVCVSQEFTKKRVWQMIFRNLKPKEDEKKILQMTEATLQGELYGLLETSKSLIVLDDIWKKEDWDLIKQIFPPGKDWKVLLTSRNENVVAVLGNTIYRNLKPDYLTTEDSWTLLQRIAFPRNDSSVPRNDESEYMIDKEMEEMGRHMIKHCQGLPLAIKVLGGLLAEKYTLHDWEIISENIRSRILEIPNFGDGTNSSVYHVLSLSFEELPSYLKQCFLYMAYFPEDYEVDIEKLCYYWAADGILEPRHYGGRTIREVGDSCIEELVRRNMVIAERSDRTLRFETCHLHDMMREICLFKAKEENFVQITNNRSQTANFKSPGTSRKLVFQFPTTLHVEKDINNPKLRSLVVVRDKDFWGESWKLSGLSFKRLELLRVLDLYKASFREKKLPSSIGKLIHLRYLSLYLAKVSHLPSSLRNLKLLIYLNLDVNTIKEYIFVPNVLMGMQELKYLALPYIMDKKTKLELRNLEKLETLRNFSTKNSQDLRGMARLRFLSIYVDEETSEETLSASISGLKHLEDLSITDDRSGIRLERIEEGIELDFIHLKRLELYIKLPRQQRFPSHLTTIDLAGCRLVDDPMPILEKLLQLKEVCLLYNSFSGRRMVCSGGGFPQLQKLIIKGLKEWEEWIVEEGSMPLLHDLVIWNCPKLKKFPNGGFPQLHTLLLYKLEEWEEWIVEEGSMPLLHTLIIRNCPKLKELPDGLRFINSLKNLEIEKEWKERLSEGGEDYYKVKHIPSIEFT